MTALKINRTDFILALTSSAENWNEAWFLDKETGELWLNSDGSNEVPDDLEDIRVICQSRLLLLAMLSRSWKTLPMNLAIARRQRRCKPRSTAASRSGVSRMRCWITELRDRWFAFEEKAVELSCRSVVRRAGGRRGVGLRKLPARWLERAAGLIPTLERENDDISIVRKP